MSTRMKTLLYIRTSHHTLECYCSFCGKFPRSHKLLLPRRARHPMSCQVTISCRELRVLHPEGRRAQAARPPPRASCTGRSPPGVLSGCSLCGPESDEVGLLAARASVFGPRHQTPRAPAPYRGEAEPGTATHITGPGGPLQRRGRKADNREETG